MAPVPQPKPEIRAELLARRAKRAHTEREEAALGLRDQVLALPQVVDADTIAAYVATEGEPGTVPLLRALRSQGVRVLLPLLRADFDLDWAELTDIAELRPGRFGILEPAGPPLGVDAVLTAQVVLCPGVAADRTGRRLGRGGGSYDRVLARLGDAALCCILLYDDEIRDEVPHDDHDQRVGAIVTPTGVVFTSARGL